MVIPNNIQEDLMPTFMPSLNWTDQGIRAVKDSPKRSEDARELAKKVGVEIVAYSCRDGQSGSIQLEPLLTRGGVTISPRKTSGNAGTTTSYLIIRIGK